MSNNTPAGWFPDPERPGQQRYWDGAQWTDNRAPGVTPQPAAPPALHQQVTPQTRRGNLVALGLIAVVVAVGVVVAVRVNSDQQASEPQESTSPAQAAPTKAVKASTFKAQVTSTRVSSPASLTVFARVKNTSDVQGRASCFVYASDASGAYEGYDNFNVRGFIKPGEEGLLRADLVVTNEGAIWATDVSVKCEDRDVG